MTSKHSLRHTYKKCDYYVDFDANTQEINFDLKHSDYNIKPAFLYKYYPFNNNSVNAILNNYIFSAHPFQLNDKYDCSCDLIDYSNLSKEYLVQRMAKDVNAFTEKTINEYFDSEKNGNLLEHFLILKY